MAKFRLSQLARNQIRAIGRFTEREFGLYQAKAYHAGLERTFSLLADFPKMGADVSERFIGGGRFRCRTASPGRVSIVFVSGIATVPIEGLLSQRNYCHVRHVVQHVICITGRGWGR